MIASLRGPVLQLTPTTAVIECGGVGLALQITPAAHRLLRPGEEGRLVTHLVVREDSVTLFGFADDAERDVFVQVQSVSGVGPRIAMALLSSMSPDDLRRAVAAEDIAALTRVPGIGRKGAQKLVIELTGKIGAPTGPAGLAAPRSAGGTLADQVVAALVGLGWKEAAASDAVGAVLAAEDAPDGVGEVLRAALRSLGGARG
jgi:Holliday junction DNA helicase RuvA